MLTCLNVWESRRRSFERERLLVGGADSTTSSSDLSVSIDVSVDGDGETVTTSDDTFSIIFFLGSIRIRIRRSGSPQSLRDQVVSVTISSLEDHSLSLSGHLHGTCTFDLRLFGLGINR